MLQQSGRWRNVWNRALGVALFIVAVSGAAEAQTTRKVYAGGTSAGGDATYDNTQIHEALIDSVCGDTILLEGNPGFGYGASGISDGAYVLPARDCEGNEITITTGVDSTGALLPDSMFPAANVRIYPQMTVGGTPRDYDVILASFVGAAANRPAIRTVTPGETANGVCPLGAPCKANGYIIKLVRFMPNANQMGPPIRLGSDENSTNIITAIGDATGNVQNLRSEQPSGLTLDRIIVRGDPIKGLKRGIGVHAKNVTVKNSWVYDIKQVGSDGQAISVTNAAGPVLIENNYLASSTENFMTGGVYPQGQYIGTVSTHTLGSPTVTLSSAPVDLDLNQWIGLHQSGVAVSTGTKYSVKVTAINGAVLTVSPAPPVSVAGWEAGWSQVVTGLTFRLNHSYKPPEWGDPIVPTPTGLAVTPGSGGTLTAGTKVYRIQARRLVQNSQTMTSRPTAEASAVVSASGTASLTWDHVTDATEYYVIGRGPTIGASVRWTVTAAAASCAATCTWVDTGSDTGTTAGGSATVTALGGTNNTTMTVAASTNLCNEKALFGGLDESSESIEIYRPSAGTTQNATVRCSNKTATSIPINETSTVSPAVDDVIYWDAAPSPSYWLVKNNFETKECIDCLIEGNVFENTWANAQTGTILNIKVQAGDSGTGYGNHNSAQLRNVTFRYNHAKNAPGALTIGASDLSASYPNGLTENVVFEHMLWEGIGVTTGPYNWGPPLQSINVSARNNPVYIPTDRGHKGITLNHITIIQAAGSSGLQLEMHFCSVTTHPCTPDSTVENFVFTNSILRKPTYGIKTSSITEGNTSWINHVSGASVFQKNAFGGVASTGTTAHPEPAENFYPTIAEWEAQFVNLNGYAGGDYRVVAGSAWENAALDGTDLGADIDAIEALTTIALSGDNSGGAPADPAPVITTTSLPDAPIGAAYSAQLTLTGGTLPVEWSLDTGSAALPAGLTLSASGLISGTPTTATVAALIPKVTDNATPTPRTDTQALTLTVPPLSSTNVRPSSTSGQALRTFDGCVSPTLTSTGQEIRTGDLWYDTCTGYLKWAREIVSPDVINWETLSPNPAQPTIVDAFVTGGNSFGATAVLGTLDGYDVELVRQAVRQVWLGAGFVALRAAGNTDPEFYCSTVDTSDWASLGFATNGRRCMVSITGDAIRTVFGIADATVSTDYVAGASTSSGGSYTRWWGVRHDGFVDVKKLRLETGAKPTCEAGIRGTFWYVAGAAGVKDTVEVCAKASDNSYAWRVIY